MVLFPFRLSERCDHGEDAEGDRDSPVADRSRRVLLKAANFLLFHANLRSALPGEPRSRIKGSFQADCVVGGGKSFRALSASLPAGRASSPPWLRTRPRLAQAPREAAGGLSAGRPRRGRPRPFSGALSPSSRGRRGRPAVAPLKLDRAGRFAPAVITRYLSAYGLASAALAAREARPAFSIWTAAWHVASERKKQSIRASGSPPRAATIRRRRGWGEDRRHRLRRPCPRGWSQRHQCVALCERRLRK